MFSGIIKAKGEVVHSAVVETGIRLGVRSDFFLRGPFLGDRELVARETNIGDSICVSGVCLTVVELETDKVQFDVSPETIRRTNFSELDLGAIVNLEPALRVGDALDGHIVQGHVDGVGEVAARSDEGATVRFAISAPKELLPLIAEKGSIAVDGVSLTVGEVWEDSFALYVIPFTLQETTLASFSIGRKVNLEVDPIARYVARQLSKG